MRMTAPSARRTRIPGIGPIAPPRVVSTVQTLPAPIGGWNQRDALSAMEATDAIILDNWVPQRGGVQLRTGFEQWGTGLSGSYVESIMPYNAVSSANSKLFASTPTIIYDVTTQGAASSSVTSMTNGRWSHVMFSNTVGNFLYLCNGADTPRYYDGSWHTTGFTGSGLTITNLDYVANHMNRLWFIEKNTVNSWYGPTSAITGTLTKFSPPFRLGGTLTALISWSRDGGSGPDDYLVFLSTTGEAALYVGTDPASADTFALVGVTKLAEPIGRRCVVTLGADVGLLTSIGVLPMSSVLGQSTSGAGQSALTNKISNAFTSSYQLASSNFGWQVIEYPKAALVIVSIPTTERSVQIQYVMNMLTGAWCSWSGINAGAFGVFNSSMFFGGNGGIVYRLNSGYVDDTASIVGTMQTAFSTLGTPMQKHFTMARPLFLSPPSYAPLINIKLDYDTSTSNLTYSTTGNPGSPWTTSPWTTSAWGAGLVPSLPWQTIDGVGVAGSIAFGVSAQSQLVFNGVDLMYQPGGPL